MSGTNSVPLEAYAYSVMPPRKTKARPNVKVQVATYHCAIVFTLEDPRRRVNQQFMGELSGWQKACDHLLIWAYDMNSRDYWIPFPNMRSQPANVRTFVKNNGRGIFMQGAGENTEFSDLRAYVMTALIWDPSRDADELTNEFLALYYGRAAKPIEFWIDDVVVDYDPLPIFKPKEKRSDTKPDKSAKNNAAIQLDVGTNRIANRRPHVIIRASASSNMFWGSGIRQNSSVLGILANPNTGSSPNDSLTMHRETISPCGCTYDTETIDSHRSCICLGDYHHCR